MLVESVSCQSECVSAMETLKTAAMEEETFCTQTLHHIKSLLTEDTHMTAAWGLRDRHVLRDRPGATNGVQYIRYPGWCSTAVLLVQSTSNIVQQDDVSSHLSSPRTHQILTKLTSSWLSSWLVIPAANELAPTVSIYRWWSDRQDTVEKMRGQMYRHVRGTGYMYTDMVFSSSTCSACSLSHVIILSL